MFDLPFQTVSKTGEQTHGKGGQTYVLKMQNNPK